MPPQVVGNASSLIQLLTNTPPSDARTALQTLVREPLKLCEERMPPEVRNVVARAVALLDTPNAG